MIVMNMEGNTFDPMAWAESTQKVHKKNRPLCVPHPTACQPLSPTDELAKATAVTRELIRIGANIAEDYRDYVRLGFALANGLGSQGRDLYHMLCAHSTKYRMSDCERKWQECLRKADGRTSIATFYHMARQAGANIKMMNNEQFKY